MSNLIPEVRADKNGKLVTRHVRADGTTINLSSLPAPAVTNTGPGSDFKGVEKALSNVLASAKAERVTDFDEEDEDGEWQEYDEEPGFDADKLLLEDAIGGELAKLPASVISEVKAKIDAEPFSDDYEVALLHALTFHRGDVQFVEYLNHFHSQVHDLADNPEDLFEDKEVNSYTVVRDYLTYLRAFQRLGFELPQHPSSMTEKEQLVMDSLLILKKESVEGEWDIEDGLARLVIDRPEDTERIMEIVEERETTDEQLIRDILDSESPSVSDGIL